MLVFVSCSNDNKFFLSATKSAIGRYETEHKFKIELFYPPNAGLQSTGSVMGNVGKILEADLILFDVTPKLCRTGDLVFNKGVMIEYGMVLAQKQFYFSQNSQYIPVFYNGQFIRNPYYRVFSDKKIRRSTYAPILVQEDITNYTKRNGKDLLIDRIFKEIEKVANFKLDLNSFNSALALDRVS